MKRFLAALAVVSAAVVAPSCNDYQQTFQGNTGAALSFLSPSDAFAGGPDFTLTLNGAGFVDKTVVQWNGQARTTTFVSFSVVTAAITAADIAKPGMVSINTLNPHKGRTDNGLSNVVTFQIKAAGNPIPAVTSISPTSAAPGSADLTLTISGTGFVPTSDPSGGSVARWNAGATPSTLALVSVSSTEIKATVTAALLAGAGSATVSVYNPPPGGGASNGVVFTIAPSPIAAQKAAEESPAITADGRFVAYAASEGNHTQIFVRDTCTGADTNCQPRTILVSAAADGTPGDADSHSPSISADGRYVAFSSAAMNLADNAPAGRQIYLRDLCFGGAPACKPSTRLISTDPEGALTGTENILPSISSSGRFVAFLSVTPSRSGGKGGAKIADGPNSGFRQVFVRDTCLGTEGCTPSTKRISLQPGDAPASGPPARPALAGDSKRIALAGRDAVLFTHGTAVDDRVFLALTSGSR